MKISITGTDDSYGMEARNETGQLLRMDASEGIGGRGTGMRPMQVMLSAAGGCSAIDVLSILRKQRQQVDQYEVELTAEQVPVEKHTEFREIKLVFRLHGQIDPVRAYRAADLSVNRYCSVLKHLEKTAKVVFQVEVNGIPVPPAEHPAAE